MTALENPANFKKSEMSKIPVERIFHTLTSKLFSLVCVFWALFQLALPSVIILDSIRIRSIHLGFALFLLFISSAKTVKKSPEIIDKSKHWFFPIINLCLAIIASLSALYIMLDWQGISLRSGLPTPRDTVIGLLVIVLLLVAARRSIGPALSIIVLIFSIYAFLGPFLPEILAFKGLSIRKYVTQITLSSEGIYGIPLGVSATVVYLFVLFGSLLEKAGGGKFFIDLAMALLGRYRGGPAKAAVASSGLMGMISGSSIANIVTTGTFTIPLMKKVGYPATKSAAIEVAASTDGQLMPPVMGAAAFIIAEYVNIPYIEVIKAAAIPAFVSYFALFYITHLEALKLDIKGLPKPDLPRFFSTLKSGIPYLISISVLIFEMIILRHSPELSAFKAILVLIATIFIREISSAPNHSISIFSALKRAFRTIGSGLVNGSKNMISVALATAAAGIIVGIVSVGIGGMITQIVGQIAGSNMFLLLLITAIASLLLGMGLPTTATYIVMASLTAPVIVQIGISNDFFIPLISAHLFCFYFGILADDTPPVGLAAYAAAAIAHSEPIPTGLQGFYYDLRTAIIPFMFIFNPDLILYGITSWPLAALIFTMAVLAAFAFTSALQGYFIIRNKWYEFPFFILASLILFNPGIIPTIFRLPHTNKYIYYLTGILILGALFFGQKLRKAANKI